MKKTFLILSFFINIKAFTQTAFSNNYDRAAAQIETGDYKSAITFFNKAILNKNLAPSNYKIADAYLYRGYCKYKLKNIKSAHKDIDEAIVIKPEYIKCYSMKSNFYLSESKYIECISWCDKGLSINSLNEDLLIDKSIASNALKKYEQSKSCLQKMLREDPKSTLALRYLGVTGLKQHLWDSAVFYFSKVLEIDPLDAASLYDRGISKSYLNDFESAETDIRKGMQIDSSAKFVGYNNLGFFLKLEQKNYLSALEYFNKAIELKPDFAYAYSNRGFTRLQLNDVKGAFKDVKYSISLDPKNSYAFKNLGLIFLKDNDLKSACINFRKAVSLGYTENYDDEVEKLIKQHCN